MEQLISFLGNLPSILNLVYVLASTIGLLLILRGMVQLTLNKDPKSKADCIRAIVIGVLLTAFGNIIDIVAITFVEEAVSPKGEMQRHITAASNSQWKEAIVSGVFAILILVGTWGVLKTLVKLSSSNSQRQEKDTKLIMSMIFSILLINMKWVLTIVESTFSFKFTFL